MQLKDFIDHIKNSIIIYKNNSVNEVIAEVYAIHGSKDPILNDLIMEELNYGRKH